VYGANRQQVAAVPSDGAAIRLFANLMKRQDAGCTCAQNCPIGATL
jgi:hypothetical protein